MARRSKFAWRTETLEVPVWSGGFGQEFRLRQVVVGHAALSSRSRLEQLALACLTTQSKGVLSPAVLLLNEMPSETLVLVMNVPTGDATGRRPDEREGRVRRSARAPRRRHRASRPSRREAARDRGTSGFSSLDAALPAAGELVRRLDVAQLLTTLARLVGAGEAVEAFRNAL